MIQILLLLRSENVSLCWCSTSEYRRHSHAQRKPKSCHRRLRNLRCSDWDLNWSRLNWGCNLDRLGLSRWLNRQCLNLCLNLRNFNRFNELGLLDLYLFRRLLNWFFRTRCLFLAGSGSHSFLEEFFGLFKLVLFL